MPASIKVNMSVLAFKRKESILEPADGQAPSHLHTSTPDPQSSLILPPHSKKRESPKFHLTLISLPFSDEYKICITTRTVNGLSNIPTHSHLILTIA